MKTTITKNKEGYGYKYTELAEINKYCEENGIRYYQEVETSEINQKDYIVTYLVKEGKEEKHRGCQIVEATLKGIKNPVQEYGSSLTYCRRYSLLMALGLATEDDDAQSLTVKEVKKVTEEQITQIKELVEDEKFEDMLNYYKIKKIEDMSYDDAVSLIARKTK